MIHEVVSSGLMYRPLPFQVQSRNKYRDCEVKQGMILLILPRRRSNCKIHKTCGCAQPLQNSPICYTSVRASTPTIKGKCLGAYCGGWELEHLKASKYATRIVSKGRVSMRKQQDKNERRIEHDAVMGWKKVILASVE